MKATILAILTLSSFGLAAPPKLDDGGKPGPPGGGPAASPSPPAPSPSPPAPGGPQPSGPQPGDPQPGPPTPPNPNSRHGLGAIGAVGIGILSGQADANDCRTWKNGCAQPNCPLNQSFIGGYCQDTNSPRISCFRGQMWDSLKRECVIIPAGQPGTTIRIEDEKVSSAHILSQCFAFLDYFVSSYG
ncbi:uncharacterized protein UV8b_05538 [Ustilaginoidea virens]|uniref:Chitin-binding type-2 domain-containing protein n=1 Tax=Ustilaginoidea virens TaxID=1159556 RepID=A0A8E5HTE0_USTVR|nr:uncharacterized protein UV8b_05538 [Ustilaginoidea virens]QUC21295.1 hypothetical protein UV8b_05538 [Ustilaginoidea virens]